MKAARLFKIGDFRTVEVARPEPHGKQILVKVNACGICGSDIPRIFELGTSKQKYPLTIGHEFGGEIVAVGEDADPTLIGKRGAMLKEIGQQARADIERMLDAKVFLELWVKVKEGWRNNQYQMRNFGYEDQ